MAEAKNAAIIELQQWDAIAITQISGNRNCAICRNEHTVPCLNIARNQQEKECPVSICINLRFLGVNVVMDFTYTV